MSIRDKIKAAYRAWLLKMADENRKNLGGSVPDCCNLLNKKKGT